MSSMAECFRKRHRRYYYSLRVYMFCVLPVLIAGCSTIGAGIGNAENVLPASANSSGVYELKRQAAQAYQKSQWIEAVQLYQQVLEQAPGDSDSWFRLGNIYAQQGALERAINAYESSLSKDSEQPKAWFNLSTAYLLNAQAAMRRAYAQLRDEDSAKGLIKERLKTLDSLVHGRFEEGVSPTEFGP